jgi:TIR domain-containing protein
LPKNGSHIFICFSSKDEAVARDVVEFLEDAGLKCWISLRDVPPGHNYQETIVHALEAARGIVFLFSESSSKSGEIKKELSIGGSINTPVFPLRLSSITPTGALRYELATRQWIDIFPDRERALGKLVETINRVLDAPAGRGTTRARSPSPQTPWRAPPLPWRRRRQRSAAERRRASRSSLRTARSTRRSGHCSRTTSARSPRSSCKRRRPKRARPMISASGWPPT